VTSSCANVTGYCSGTVRVIRIVMRYRKVRSTKGIAVWGAAGEFVALPRAPIPQGNDPQPLNQLVRSAMTYVELSALLKVRG
jgi:hypothetical protein